ncbi:MAG TPA: DUF1592 domain-containing protein [Bryobacteraceae bacterium]|nr:DUF1592 domain-containing protein [Bryobacteraceae bacterium]
MIQRYNVVAAFLSLTTCLAASPQATASHPTFETTVRPFITKTCVGCHNAKLKSGELNLDNFTDAASVLGARDTWEHVAQKLRTGEMPPKGLPRPTAADIRAVTGWIDSEFERIDKRAKPDPGRVTARRLNRVEYNNTIRDLIGVNFRPADDFPADDSGYGFDNIGDVLSLSPVLMEKYLAAAGKIAKAAVVVAQPTYKATRERFEAERLKRGHPLDANQAGPAASSLTLHTTHKFPAEADYELRFSLGGIRPGDAPLVKLAVWLDGEQVKVFEVNPAQGKTRNFDLKLKIAPGLHHIGAGVLDDDFDEHAAVIGPRDRLLTLDTIEIRGPYNALAPALPESHRRILICGHALGKHTPECARLVLSNLAGRAYRRPVTEAEVNRLLRFVSMAREEGDSFERGVQVALEAVLVSPHFLFRMEQDLVANGRSTPHEISPFELASRLSYFLWSSMPDEELFRAAESGRLKTPENLRSQVDRMLLDPKATSLVDNFAGQWLELRNLDTVKPDPDKFPAWDSELREAMRTETKLFFEAIVKEDRSILDFLDGNFTFLNDRLAQHYGIPGVEGNQFRRVALKSGERSGVLTQASVLTVSSYPNRTSPVIRGKWILENFLNAPPPPPPPNVPNLDEAAVGTQLSLRQQLEKHRANSVCASCHSKMDPLGFGLENYDAIGAWRSRDGKFPIDSSGILPNGKSFKTPAQLKAILKSDKDAFSRCLTEKLLTYALGRGLERYDRPAVNSIGQKLAAKQYRFSQLVMEIVTSLPFQMRRGEGGKS